jgi:hypothetical protein
MSDIRDLLGITPISLCSWGYKITAPLSPSLLVEQPRRLDTLAMRSSIAIVGEFSWRSIMPT